MRRRARHGAPDRTGDGARRLTAARDRDLKCPITWRDPLARSTREPFLVSRTNHHNPRRDLDAGPEDGELVLVGSSSRAATRLNVRSTTTIDSD
jgi:hypothetical protein